MANPVCYNPANLTYNPNCSRLVFQNVNPNPLTFVSQLQSELIIPFSYVYTSSVITLSFKNVDPVLVINAAGQIGVKLLLYENDGKKYLPFSTLLKWPALLAPVTSDMTFNLYYANGQLMTATSWDFNFGWVRSPVQTSAYIIKLLSYVVLGQIVKRVWKKDTPSERASKGAGWLADHGISIKVVGESFYAKSIANISISYHTCSEDVKAGFRAESLLWRILGASQWNADKWLTQNHNDVRSAVEEIQLCRNCSQFYSHQVRVEDHTYYSYIKFRGKGGDEYAPGMTPELSFFHDFPKEPYVDAPITADDRDFLFEGSRGDYDAYQIAATQRAYDQKYQQESAAIIHRANVRAQNTIPNRGMQSQTTYTVGVYFGGGGY